MTSAYWAWQYILVLTGFILVEFVWPHIVFAGHLRHKSPIYRFGFCVSVQTVLCNTVVLGLGLVHLLNRWTVCAVFYGIPLVAVVRKLIWREKKPHAFWLATPSGVFQALVKRAFRKLQEVWKRKWPEIRPHLWEYLILTAITVYALVYFSWGSFQTLCYGFGDQYTHHSWIYGLVEGKPFSAGVYPEAMHCLLYTIHTLLGVRVHSLVLFSGGIQGTLFLISSYCLFRELFCWRYTPLFTLAAFLLLYTETWRELDGMARLQWALPLEFGLAPQMLCVLFLIRYLKNGRCAEEQRFIWGGDLFVFMAALSSTISSHFYPLIAAFFMCWAIAALNFKKTFIKKRFIPLAAAVLCGLMISLAPMLAALASGIPMQGSMGWAMSVISGTADESREVMTSETAQESKQEPEQSPIQETAPSELPGGMAAFLISQLRTGLDDLTGASRSGFFAILMATVIPVCLVLRLIVCMLPSALRERMKKRGVWAGWFGGYPQLLLMELFLLLLYIAPYLGLPELVLGVRLASTERILLFALASVPLDFLFSLLLLAASRVLLQFLSLVCLAAICFWGTRDEFYHGYLYCELTRYHTEVSVLSDMIDKYPQFKYTVVSPTDCLYHVAEYGRHEELLLFVQKASEGRYFLPTEHVFIFVEKHPLNYAQRFYFSGPEWLALCRNGQPSEVETSEVSKEALQNNTTLPISFNSYTNLESRTVIESRAYYWCQYFAHLYPHEMQVYYEDDNFVCYYFEQEPLSPFDLSIDYENLYEEQS